VSSRPDPRVSASPRRLTVNLAVLAAGEVMTRGLTFLAFVHLARVLEPATFGLVEWVLAVMQLAMLVVDQGLGILGAREVARAPERTAELIRRVSSAQLVLAIGVVVALGAAGAAIPMDGALRVLLIGFGVSLLGVPLILNWVFQGLNEMIWFAVPQILRQATFLLVVVLAVAAPGDVYRLPLAEIAAVAVAAGSYMVLVHRHGLRFRVSVRRALDRRLFRESLPIGGANFVWALRMYLPIVLLFFVAGRETTALFGVSHRIVMVFQSLLGVYFTNLFPTMSQVATDLLRLQRLLNRSLLLTAACAAAGAAVMPLVSAGLLGAVYGPAFVRAESVWTLTALTWMIPILAWRRHGTSALIALNRQMDDLRCSIAGVVLLLVLLVPASSAYGAPGATAAMLVSELFAAVLTWKQVQTSLARQASLFS
jgi:PST family polysaccharide transporter